jgi:hypothetical protein
VLRIALAFIIAVAIAAIAVTTSLDRGPQVTPSRSDTTTSTELTIEVSR